jgi:hypothetical protein
MTVSAAHCEAKLHGFRRTADGVVVSFVLHPAEVPSMLALDPLGTRYMLAVAVIGDDEQPVATKTNQRSEAGKQRYAAADPASQAVTRAALLPSDERFRKWASVGSQGHAEAFIRSWCHVKSRREIAEQEPALERFLEMELTYLTETGQMAEAR